MLGFLGVPVTIERGTREVASLEHARRTSEFLSSTPGEGVRN